LPARRTGIGITALFGQNANSFVENVVHYGRRAASALRILNTANRISNYEAGVAVLTVS